VSLYYFDFLYLSVDLLVIIVVDRQYILWNIMESKDEDRSKRIQHKPLTIIIVI